MTLNKLLKSLLASSLLLYIPLTVFAQSGGSSEGGSSSCLCSDGTSASCSGGSSGTTIPTYPVICAGHEPSSAVPYVCTAGTPPRVPDTSDCPPGIATIQISLNPGQHDPVDMGAIYNGGHAWPSCLHNNWAAADSFCRANIYGGAVWQGVTIDGSNIVAAMSHCYDGSMSNQMVWNGFENPAPSNNPYGVIHWTYGTIYTVANDTTDPTKCTILGVTDPAIQAECGGIEADIEESPISIVLDPEFDINSQIALNRFPMDLRKSDQLHSWKASEKAPLLVFDPEHKGIISSASQLFGDWTFGGQAVASLVDNRAEPIKWDNGFQALATLDRNGDGVISGDELSSLALWFDKNQDGISQPGEVRSLADVGITKLYYGKQVTNPGSRDVYVMQGYERVVDAKAVTGPAVDWYAGLDANPEALTAKLIAETKPLAYNDSLISNKPRHNLTEYQKNLVTNLNGLWEWSTLSGESKSGKVPSDGLMVVVVGPNGDINLRSTSIRSGSLNIKGRSQQVGLMSMTAHTGTVSFRGSGNPVLLTENIKAAGSAVTLKNTITVENGGTMLLGTTVGEGKTSDGKRVSVRYSWQATRYKH